MSLTHQNVHTSTVRDTEPCKKTSDYSHLSPLFKSLNLENLTRLKV